ncbi:nuclear receptor coactivator 4-like [Palaemon carinicauda]|uniref:nuclear receptor coactivator 4-like n=1 Tax=Palaemon carinicauda TaxID=392227 RepID=UPI0035B68719
MSLEKLELDVAVKLALVDKSLKKVEDYQKQLQENARNVKEDIHEAVNRQVLALRGRERLLVRQVEVVTAHQNCLLSTQQAGLMHSQGALTATKNLLQRCTSADVSTLSKINMDDIPCTSNIQPANLVSVDLNEAALTSAIGAFGSVQLPETITHHPSPVIPAKVEEYEDEDHDVLHKSVAGAASGPDSPMRITVQFPRLNQQSWLIDNKPRNAVTGSPTKVCIAGDSKCTVTSWLSNLQIAGTQDEEEVAPTPFITGSFDLISNYGSTPPLTSESSSIEIVPNHFDTDKDCSTQGSLCEIENLSNCIEDKSCWLRPKQTSSERSPLQQIKIADVCQANEPCSNFSECICKGSCVDSALQKAKQSAAYYAKTSRKRTISEVYSSNPVLSHMADILSSDNSQWLVKSSSGHTHMPKRAMYKAPGEMWLSSSTTVPATSPQASRVVMSTHSNIWLLNKLKAEKTKDKKEKIEDGDEKDIRQTSKDELSMKYKDFGLHHEILTKMACDNEPVIGTIVPSSACYSQGNKCFSNLFDNKFFDDKMHDLTLGKNPWLACNLSASPNLKLSKTASTLAFTTDSMLTVAQSSLDSWLLKRL